MRIYFMVPVKTVSEANKREHWAVRAKRTKEQRTRAKQRTRAAMRQQGPCIGTKPNPILVHMVRMGPRKLDSDNLAGALKHVRDGIADALGVDDGDDAQALWTYGWGKNKTYWVNVSIDF